MCRLKYDVIRKRALSVELIFVVDEGRVHGVCAVVTVKSFMQGVRSQGSGFRGFRDENGSMGTRGVAVGFIIHKWKNT